MKNKKRGFSLIELLAVVIILAILALILIPFIGNLIKQAKINSAVVSAYGYVEATNNEIVSKQTKGEYVAETQYEIENFNIVGNSLSIKYEGKGPEKGWFTLSRSKVYEGAFCINGYEVSYVNGKATYVENGEFCAPPPRPTMCRVNDGDLNYENTTNFEISSLEDLVCLSDLVNNNGYTFVDKVVTLTKNLDFNDTASYNNATGILNNHTAAIKDEITTGSGFVPIGNETNPFNGLFTSSNFNSISNLYIKRSGKNVGLFGYIGTTGVVSDIRIESSSITGGDGTAAVVGFNYGKIENVVVTDTTIKGSNDVGGISGLLDGSINKVYVEATISGTKFVGGIAGRTASQNGRNPKISNAVAKSKVSGSNNIGGFIGSPYYTSTNTFNGVVTGGSVSGSTYVGKMFGSTANYLNNGKVYVSSDVTKSGSGGYDGRIYDSSKHYIGMLDDVIDTYYGGAENDYYFDFVNGNLELVKVNDNTFNTTISGSGTATDPYILATEKDFRDAATLLSGLNYFKIANDLDISTFDYFYNLGTNRNPFSGYLDGNNKIISNMHLNGGKNGGFVGVISSGSIKDLTINSSTVKYIYGEANLFSNDASKTGLLVGFAGNNVNIDNISIGSNQSVTGYTCVGGVIGYLGSNSKLTNLLPVDNITVKGSFDNTGGIVGQSLAGSTLDGIVISNSTIIGANNTGGVVGHVAGTITNTVVNNISVTGDNNTGGLAGGSDGTVTKAYISGNIVGKEFTGGSIGKTGYYSNSQYILKEMVVNANVTGTRNVGGFMGSVYYTNNNEMTGVVTGGKVTGSSNVGKLFGATWNYLKGKIFISTDVTKTGSGGYDGRIYDSSKPYIGMLDDVIDTYYGGAENNYYFDFVNGNLELVKVDDNTFNTTISGSGTATDPYILATEKDFRDAAILLSGLNYFRIANDLDISTFDQFYNLGTNRNPFSGHLDGNNKIISNMHLNGGVNAGFIGIISSGSIKNLTINSSSVKYIYGETNMYNDSSKVGLLAGYIGNNVVIDNIKIENNLNVSGYNYVGGIAGYIGNNSPLSNISKIDGIIVSGVGNYVGGLTGYLGTSSSINGLNINNATISGKEYTGGVVGFTLSNVTGVNVSNLSLTGTKRTGGIAGCSDATIREVTVRGNITGTEDVGGVVGLTQSTSNSSAYIYNALVNANVSGTKFVGGLFGLPYYGAKAVYGVVEGGHISSSSYAGKAVGYASAWTGTVYVSSSVQLTGSGGHNGTVFNSDEGNLNYYGSIKYNTNQPLLDSPITGDINKTGWWFVTNSDDEIVVVRTTDPYTPISEPVVDSECTENCSLVDIERIGTVSGTCPDGDVTPPVCTFYEFGQSVDGIKAYFSCTDDTSVPTVASMFNSTTKEAYTFDMITDSSRGGTVKNGTVSGNTRTIRSTWSRSKMPQNPPQAGLCYYYQFAAKDSCGNESYWVTSNCGISN